MADGRVIARSPVPVTSGVSEEKASSAPLEAGVVEAGVVEARVVEARVVEAGLAGQLAGLAAEIADIKSALAVSHQLARQMRSQIGRSSGCSTNATIAG